MKKYKLRFLCGMMIVAMTLTACQNNLSNNPSGGGQNTESQNSEADKEDENAITKKSDILNNGEFLDEKGAIKYISNKQVESGIQQEIEFYKGNLLLWGTATDGASQFRLSLISLETGEVLQEKNFDAMDLPSVQICGDKIAVVDWGIGEVAILDSAFEIIDEYQTGTEYCPIYLSPDATSIYCFTQEGVEVTDVETGNQEVLFDNALMLYASSRCGNSVSVTYTDRDTQLNAEGVVDLATGTAQTIPFSGAFQGVEYSDGVWLAGVMDEQNTYYIGKTQRPNSFKGNSENSMMTLLANPARIMSTSYDQMGTPTLEVYDLDGKFLSRLELPVEGATMMYEPIWSEADGGYFFLVIDSTGKDILLFWDMSIPTTGNDLTLQSKYDGSTDVESTVSQELRDRAEEIGDTYGVTIFLGEETEEEYGSYYVNREMDETYISSALDEVEAALGKYPEGFMSQLLYGDQKQIEIHLVGAFTMKDLPSEYVNGFTSYVGLAEEQAGKTVVVLDITTPGSLEQTLHHEIMHVIDNKLIFDATIREDAFYSEEGWNACNPADFVYPDTKINLPDSIYQEGYEGYFIDIYSRTTAKEDRARIMEYAMVEADWAFSGSPGRYEKLEYLCECIRDSFDTTGWPEETLWEQTLNRSNY